MNIVDNMEALAFSVNRKLSRTLSGRPPVNTLSPEESESMRRWESEGRSDFSFRDNITSNKVEKMKMRMESVAKAIETFDCTSGEPLSQQEIMEVRKCLIVEIGCGDLWPYLTDMEHNMDLLMQKLAPSSLTFLKEVYKGAPSPIMVNNDPNFAELRKIVRATNAKIMGEKCSTYSIREYFASQGVQERPIYTCSLVSNSDILMGQGPNGGHIGHGMFSSNMLLTKPKSAPSPKEQVDPKSHFTHLASHLPELWLSGGDINRFFYHKMKRDDEVIGFLAELNEMKVGAVVANGYPRAYTMTNLKTGLASKDSYADELFFQRPGFQTMTRSDKAYHESTPRDFFNYFGARDGDDGLAWEDCKDGTRICYIQDYVLYSSLKKSETNALGSKTDLYELTVSRQSGCCCISANEEFKLDVLNIRTWDQSPALLSNEQVKMLVDLLVDLDDENHYLFVHCAGGIGRTGNLAYAISEVMCDDVPNDPLRKLDWLRLQRPGSVQTPEQLLDGMILSYKILDEVVNRTGLSFI